MCCIIVLTSENVQPPKIAIVQTREMTDFSLVTALFQLLSDVGIQTDLIPVGREVAGVILQGQKHPNKNVMWDD